jgi:hypothetical protein
VWGAPRGITQRARRAKGAKEKCSLRLIFVVPLFGSRCNTMARMRFIHIESQKFPIAPGEQAEDTHGVFGKALAEYLAGKLDAKGYDNPSTCCEDWGWWIEVRGQPFVLGLCVYGASDASEKPELCVKISRDAGNCWSWKRFRLVDTTKRVEQLFGDLNDILSSDPEIRILGLTDRFPLGQ